MQTPTWHSLPTGVLDILCAEVPTISIDLNKSDFSHRIQELHRNQHAQDRGGAYFRRQVSLTIFHSIKLILLFSSLSKIFFFFNFIIRPLSP